MLDKLSINLTTAMGRVLTEDEKNELKAVIENRVGVTIKNGAKHLYPEKAGFKTSGSVKKLTFVLTFC